MLSRFYTVSIFAILLLLITVLINAWIGDDAMILFRQVWNLVTGYGITFNYQQRVQAFSDPLWFFVLSFIGFVTRELFVTTITISVILTILSALLLIKIQFDQDQEKQTFFTPVLFLPFSWAFIDYSTSGLENSLSYFLVGLLFYILANGNIQKHIRKLFLLLTLLFLNRMDYVILFLPLILYLIWNCGNIRKLFHNTWLSILIVICWFIFSTLYFGSPVPNTFYAKLNSGYPLNEVLIRGIHYVNSMKLDIVSVFIILSATILSIFSKSIILIGISIGQLLYICYITWIGGDFMLGRFFAILVYISVGQITLLLCKIQAVNFKIWNTLVLFILVAIILIGWSQRYPFLLQFDNYESRRKFEGVKNVGAHIIDEKMHYYLRYGLFSPTRTKWPKIQPHPGEISARYIATCGGLGQKILFREQKYIIDQCALSDPFLARIPAIQSEIWRIGHHFRKMPTEYGEYMIGNIDAIPDKKLNPLLNDIMLISTGKLTDYNRLSAIWRINSGYYSNIDFSDYTSTNVWVPKTLTEQIYTTENWDNSVENINFNGILAIESKTPTLATSMRLIINNGYKYEVYINDRYLTNVLNNKIEPTTIKFPIPTMVKSVKFVAIHTDYKVLPVIKVYKLELLNE